MHNNMYISGYTKLQSYMNNKKTMHNEKAFEYDGSKMDIYSNQNGKIQYHRLNNDDLHSLVKHIDYQKHTKPLLLRLKDDFALGRGAKKTVKRLSNGKRKQTQRRKPTRKHRRKSKQRKSRK